MNVLRPITQAEYATWLADVVPAYAADKIAAGQWTQEAALELSKKEYDDLLPLGPETPDHHIFAILDDLGEPVGLLWFAVETKFNTRIAFVYDVSVHHAHQRHGHGRRAFVALEQEVRRLGLAGIALHVFGHNTAARALYDQLGFQPTNISLYKPVAAASAQAGTAR